MSLLKTILNRRQKGKPFVHRDGRELSLHFSEPVVQSNMNLDQPDVLALGYTRTMMGFLLFVPEPKKISMIGLGGGSLPKYCYRQLPDSKISVAEINPDVVALRNEFLIPEDDGRFRIHCEDGARFIKNFCASEDVIVVDGYDIAGHAPSLCTEKFYADCYRALSRQGVMVVNLFGKDRQNYGVVTKITKVFGDAVFVVESEDITNKVVFAIKRSPEDLSHEELFLTAIVLMSQMNIDFHRVLMQLLSHRCFK